MYAATANHRRRMNTLILPPLRSWAHGIEFRGVARVPVLKRSRESEAKASQLQEPVNKRMKGTDREAFLEHGFRHEPFKSKPQRVGRWGRAETTYAIRLMQALLTGEKKTPYRRCIRDVFKEELHTNSARVFKKFRGNKLLRVSTFSQQGKVLPTVERPAWHDIVLVGYENLQHSVLATPLDELREQFLSSTYFEVSETF